MMNGDNMPSQESHEDLDLNKQQSEQPVTLTLGPSIESALEAKAKSDGLAAAYTSLFFHPQVSVEVEQTGGNLHDAVVAKGHQHLREALSTRQKFTLPELTSVLEAASQRWLNNGAVCSCSINVNERLTKSAAAGDNAPSVSSADAIEVDVAVKLRAAKQVREIGVFTTDTAVPEVRLGWRNFWRGMINFQLNYIPPAAQRQSWCGSIVANAPPIADRAELNFGLRKETYYMHPADAEKIEDVRIQLEKRSSPFMTQSLNSGYEVRQMAARDQESLPRDITRDFVRHSKLYTKHTLHYQSSEFHAHPALNDMYPLPVRGSDLFLTNELSLAAFSARNNFWKVEFQGMRSFMLHPLMTLDLNFRCGAITTPGNGSRVPLNDRFFLSWRHIRGFRSVGPSTVDLRTASDAPTRFSATGGNAVWALSASLNMPFWLYPQNGLAALHVFANAGNVAMYNTLSELRRGWGDLFRNHSLAIGAGLVITRIPLVGALPNGRIELNCSFPVSFDERQKRWGFTAKNKYLTDRFRFGIVWCSTLQN